MIGAIHIDHPCPASSQCGVKDCKDFPMAAQTIEVPVALLKRIDRILTRFEKEDTKQTAQWLDAGRFAAKTGMSRDQVRYFRNKHPELVRPKAQSTQYQYDYSGWFKIYAA